MNFLEYSNRTQSNIIPKEKFEELICEVFNVITENISNSLGPLGSHATILDGMLTDSTKDGFAIFSSYRFHNRYKKMIYNLIKAPCTRLNNTVGDGTTTAIVFASCLFKQYTKSKNELETLHRLPRTFVQIWDEVINELTEDIKRFSTPLNADDYETIYNICYVTSNGNAEISENIAEIYRITKAPNIKQKNSPTNKSYISPIIGFEFPANIIDEAYARNEDLSVEHQDISVMIFDHKIEADFCEKFIIPLNEILRAQHKKLLILAPSYDAHMCETMLRPYLNMEYQKFGKLNLVLSQFANGKLDPYQLTDLATVLRTFIINQELTVTILEEFTSMSGDKFVEKVNEEIEYKFHKIIGTAASALLSCKNGSIFRVENIESDERYCDILRVAKKELDDIIATTDYEHQSYTSKIYNATARINQLEMKNFIYYIGANSRLQHKITWDSVEDVIKCTRSATKHGTVPGCQISIVNSCIDSIKKLTSNMTNDEIMKLHDNVKLKIAIFEIISNAVINVYAKVLNGPANTGIMKTIPLWQYIDENGREELANKTVEKSNEIILESINKKQVFDLESLTFNEKIITSAETDVMVLMAASELVKILISGNQCIFLDSDVNESHNEELDVNV